MVYLVGVAILTEDVRNYQDVFFGYLMGRIGAILTVPITMLMLIIMENFEVTRQLVILMCYTGQDERTERN